MLQIILFLFNRALVLIFGKEKLLRIDRNWDKLIDYCKQNNTYYANVKNN